MQFSLLPLDLLSFPTSVTASSPLRLLRSYHWSKCLLCFCCSLCHSHFITKRPIAKLCVLWNSFQFRCAPVSRVENSRTWRALCKFEWKSGKLPWTVSLKCPGFSTHVRLSRAGFLRIFKCMSNAYFTCLCNNLQPRVHAMVQCPFLLSLMPNIDRYSNE